MGNNHGQFLPFDENKETSLWRISPTRNLLEPHITKRTRRLCARRCRGDGAFLFSILYS